ncbi:hypothetical protein ABVT39_021930 [Epinephelus coioides]
MAELCESPFSLMSLEDELTCSICLSTFDCPVTIPCGHNFCQDCLLATWKDSYSCPQCLTIFSTKPELKKNTVLSTVVETISMTSRSEAGLVVEESKAEEKDSDLRDKLGLLDGKIEKTETVLFQMNDMQSKLKDAATKRKTALATVYQQMRDMLAQEEREAQYEVDHELENSQTKLQDLMKKLIENTEKMAKARADVNSLLSQSQTLAFLQASFDLPKAVKFDAHVPRITLDSKKVTATQTFAAALREHLAEILKQPVEARLLMLKEDEKAVPVSGPASTESTGSQPVSEVPEPPEQKNMPSSHSPGCPPVQPLFQPIPVPVYIGSQAGWNLPQHHLPGVYRGPRFTGQKTKQDKRPPKASGGNNQSEKGSDFKKKDKPRSHPSSEKSTKPHPRPHKNK